MNIFKLLIFVFCVFEVLFGHTKYLYSYPYNCTFDQLSSKVQDDDKHLLYEIYKCASHTDHKEINRILKLLKNANESVALRLGVALAAMGKDSIQPICRILDGNSTDLMKLSSIVSLAYNNKNAKDATHCVFKYISYHNSTVSDEALNFFNIVPFYSFSFIDALLKKSGEDLIKVNPRSLSTHILSKYYVNNSTIKEYISNQLGSADKYKSLGAAYTHFILGNKAIPTLKQMLKSSSDADIIGSIFTVGLMSGRGKEALPDLEPLIYSTNASISSMARCAIDSVVNNENIAQYAKCIDETNQDCLNRLKLKSKY